MNKLREIFWGVIYGAIGYFILFQYIFIGG